MNTEGHMNEVVNYFGGTYDDRDDHPYSSVSLHDVANHFKIPVSKVRKILITAGRYSTKKSRIVSELLDQGKSISEISEITGLSKSTIHSLKPYKTPPCVPSIVKESVPRGKWFTLKQSDGTIGRFIYV